MAILRIEMSPEGKRTIEQHADRPQDVRDALSQALRRGLIETESHVTNTKFDGSPIQNRLGTLQQAVTHEMDDLLSGWVGVGEGPASSYARTILGRGTTTIRPKKANHLWIPIADNRTDSGRARLSPREAMERRGPEGGRLLSIFKSKRGNLVAVLRDKVPGVRRKGGKLLFVLKKQVRVEGTDALAEGVEEMRDRIGDLLDQGLHRGLGGQA